MNPIDKGHAVVKSRIKNIVLTIPFLAALPAFAQTSPVFTPGNLVVAVEGCGVYQGTCTSVPKGTGDGTLNSSVGGYGDNQAAPLTLFQFTPAGAFVNSLVLPQAASGANFPVSGEYGSSSEGTLQLSGGTQYLTIFGYGIPAVPFDAAYFPGFLADPYGAAPSGALAQSGSLTGQSYTPIPRVVALIDANGNVNSSTALFNIFNNNNPRSIYTLNGTSAYVSGQGNDDATGGVFFTALGAINSNPTSITGLDTATSGGAAFGQDTRDVQIVNNTLYVSVDSKEGKGFNRSFIGTLGTPPATSLFNNAAGPTELSGFGNSGGTGKVSITSGGSSNGNNLNAGLAINLSPVGYFFASPSVLYVADSGNPKNDSNGDNNSTGTTSLGDGGLQKWVNSKSDGSGTWSLKYTLYQGLNLVNNGSPSGTTGLYGLAGKVSGATVQLFATTAVVQDLDQTYLYTITDTLSNTTPPGTSLAFTQLAAAPSDSNFKGVSFAPTIPAGAVEITSSPSGLAFTSSGTGCAPGTYTTPQTLSWTPSSRCTLSVVSPQTGAPDVQYAFAQWEDGATSTSHTVTAPGTTATYTASFKIVPTITWPMPAAITFGGALSSEQLNATANVPGAFVYTPSAGTVLPVGNSQPLSVTFTPTDTTDYATDTASNTITVNPAAGPATLVLTETLARDTLTNNVLVTVTLANTGGSAATNVQVSSAAIGSTKPITTLPLALADVPAGGSSSAVLAFPASVGASGSRAVLALTGAYSGGSFGGSTRVVLP